MYSHTNVSLDLIAVPALHHPHSYDDCGYKKILTHRVDTKKYANLFFRTREWVKMKHLMNMCLKRLDVNTACYAYTPSPFTMKI